MDPTGRSRSDCTSRTGWLFLSPAQDADVWPEVNFDAPRLMATVAGEYVAQTRVEVGEIGEIHAGLLIWQDAQNFLRLEVFRLASDRVSVQMSAMVSGSFLNVGRGNLDRGPIWLRVERRGDEVRGLCSLDGERWLTAGAVPFSASEWEQVGLVAHCQWANAQVWFDEFSIWQEASP
jgi:regulation of enolase protein 1 (concanavalin A-like superfamily)